MAILKNLKRWFLLTLARLTAIGTLIFAFEQGIQGIQNDVRRFRDCRASGSNCQPPQQLIVGPSGSPEPIDVSITGLVPESTVPFHRSGFFFACLHWAFYLLSLVVLLLIELPNCSRLHRIVEALVSLLLPVNHHSIAPQGAAMVYMGLDVNSRSVPKDTRVSGWLLMVVGFVYIFLSLVFICYNVRQMRSFNLAISRNALATRASFRDVLRRRRDELVGKPEEDCQPLPTQKRTAGSASRASRSQRTRKDLLLSLFSRGLSPSPDPPSSHPLQAEGQAEASPGKTMNQHVAVGMPEPAHLPASLSRSCSALSGRTLAPSDVLPCKMTTCGAPSFLYKTASPSLATSSSSSSSSLPPSRIDVHAQGADEWGYLAHHNAL